ncbi:MAG: hypothetical protein HC901_04395 [Bdellovibrionaceae bacterium]|nr:hypothetical protein [Pseudobdellovibrionaceae bacterium]
MRIDTWQIVDGRLILNFNKGVKDKFDADRAAHIQQADANWPELAAKKK